MYFYFLLSSELTHPNRIELNRCFVSPLREIYVKIASYNEDHSYNFSPILWGLMHIKALLLWSKKKKTLPVKISTAFSNPVFDVWPTFWHRTLCRIDLLLESLLSTSTGEIQHDGELVCVRVWQGGDGSGSKTLLPLRDRTNTLATQSHYCCNVGFGRLHDGRRQPCTLALHCPHSPLRGNGEEHGLSLLRFSPGTVRPQPHHSWLLTLSSLQGLRHAPLCQCLAQLCGRWKERKGVKLVIYHVLFQNHRKWKKKHWEAQTKKCVLGVYFLRGHLLNYTSSQYYYTSLSSVIFCFGKMCGGIHVLVIRRMSLTGFIKPVLILVNKVKVWACWAEPSNGKTEPCSIDSKVLREEKPLRRTI